MRKLSVFTLCCCLTIFVTSNLLAADSSSVTAEKDVCGDYSELHQLADDTVIECLQKYALARLNSSDVVELYRDHLDTALSNLPDDLTVASKLPSEKFNNLGSARRVRVLKKGSGEYFPTSSCYNFSREAMRSGVARANSPGISRAEKIANLQRSISEAMKFLAYFHGRSYGKNVSALFKVNAIKFCGQPLAARNPSKPFALKAGTLHIGLKPKRSYLLEDYIKAWKSGDMVLEGEAAELLPSGGIISKVLGSPYLKAFKLVWKALLNPIGDIRVKLHAKIIKNLGKGSGNGRSVNKAMARDRLLKIANSGRGFSEDDLRDLNSQGVMRIYDEYKRQLRHIPKIINFVLSSSVADTSRVYIDVSDVRSFGNFKDINATLGLVSGELAQPFLGEVRDAQQGNYHIEVNKCGDEDPQVNLEGIASADVTIIARQGVQIRFEDRVHVKLPAVNVPAIRRYLLKEALLATN